MIASYLIATFINSIPW